MHPPDDMLMDTNNPSAEDAQNDRFYKRVWSEITAKSIDGIISD